jgi:hypothetical protein
MKGSRQARFSTGFSDDTLAAYEPGCICWLKPKNEFADDVGMAELPVGCYNRPAVLLWTENSGAKAVIFTVCSSSPSILGCD